MPGYVNIGDRYTDWSKVNVNDRDYMILKPRKMLLDIFKYKREPVEWDMKVIAIVGPQGSGKTVIIRYFVALIRSIKIYAGRVAVVRTNDLRILSDPRYKYLFDGYHVIVLIIDDAIREGLESRRAMSGANVDLTQQFCITRHILEENFRKNGIIFMIFAFQVYTRLDPTIRNTAQLKIFTAYYDQNWFQNLFTPEQSELLRIATYEGMVSSNFDARRFSLCRTMTGDTATIEVPFSKSSDVPITYIDRNLTTDDAVGKLVEYLLNEIDDFVDYKQGELIGALIDYSKSIEKDFAVKLKTSDYAKAINLAKWRRKMQCDEATETKVPEIKVSDDMTNLDKIVAVVKLKRIASVKTVSDITGLDSRLVTSYLSTHKHMFDRVSKGFYSLVDETYNDDDLFNLTNKKHPLKKLEMGIKNGEKTETN